MSLAVQANNVLLVIGVGNTYRRDDGVGRHVARGLTERHPTGLKICEQSGEGAALMDAWQCHDDVVIVDAVRSGASAGAIHRLDAAENKIPAEFFHYSTHAFSLAEAVEMSRVLGTLPKRLLIYGIEGKDFGAGEQLSPEVAQAADEVMGRILNHVALKGADKNARNVAHG